MNIGDLKSHCLLWTILARNQRYSHLVDERDIQTVIERCGQEGLSFLTIALPSIGRALDRFHSTKEWKPPMAFSKREVDGLPLPIFLGRAVKLALEGDTLAVDCVRQLSYVFYKLEVPYDKVLVEDFLNQFIQTDKDLLRSSSGPFEKYPKDSLRLGMKRLIARILCNTNPLDIRPTHAGGATACRTKNQDKWHKLRYYPKLDAVYPYSDYFFFNHSHLVDEYDKLELSETKDPMARVCLVPKDSRGPRVISCEPAELMYIQKGQQRYLYNHIETHYLTRGYVNFTHQGYNRALAKLGSENGFWATIDLKEASDRVSLDLVRQVFPADWVRALEASRSERTLLPNGKIVELNKFAPMGSACCFPVEALIFFACAWAKLRELGVRKPEVYVYGDDIIVASQYCEVVMEALESIDLVVNREKSFYSGPFRESCGGDYHLGENVTPVRVRKVLNKSHTNLLVGADLCNNIIAKFGYDSSLRFIDYIENLIDYRFPRTQLPIPGTIRCNTSASNDVFFHARFNKALQRREYRILQPITRAFALRKPDWNELLRKELAVGCRSRVTGDWFDQAADEEIHQTVGIWASDKKLSSVGLKPGEYVPGQGIRTSWSWVWLG